MNIDKMKRFARDLRRHAGIEGLKLSHAQAMTARIHGRRDWHHLEQEGPDTHRSRDAMIESLAGELLRAASTVDVDRIAAALMPDRTFSALPEGQRWSRRSWDATDVFLDHERHRQYAARLQDVPAGGIMILNGDWAMAPVTSHRRVCSDAGVTNLQVSMTGTVTAAGLAYCVRAEALDTVRSVQGTEKAIAAAIDAIGDGASTIITVENMERAIERSGPRVRATVAALVRMVRETGSRAVIVLDDEHADRDAAEAALRAMPDLEGVHVESFDFAPYAADDPEFERYVNLVASTLPMKADPIRDHDLQAFHALSMGMVEHVSGSFSRGMEYLALDGRRIERMNRTALAAVAQAMREHFGDYVALDRNPFTGLRWKDQGQERRRRERLERKARRAGQGDPLDGLEGIARAIRYVGLEESGDYDNLPLLREPARSPVSIRQVLETPVDLVDGHYAEGERWWTVVDGVAFKLRISADQGGRWKIGIRTPGRAARYADGMFHFDRNRHQGHVAIACDTPFPDEGESPVMYRDAEDLAPAILGHVVAATDPTLATIEPGRRRTLQAILRAAMLASGSVEGTIRLGLGSDAPRVHLSGATGDSWNDVLVTLGQEVQLAFPDAIGRSDYAGALRASGISCTNRRGERRDESSTRKALEGADVPMALVDAIAALASPALRPADQDFELRMAR